MDDRDSKSGTWSGVEIRPVMPMCKRKKRSAQSLSFSSPLGTCFLDVVSFLVVLDDFWVATFFEVSHFCKTMQINFPLRRMSDTRYFPLTASISSSLGNFLGGALSKFNRSRTIGSWEETRGNSSCRNDSTSGSSGIFLRICFKNNKAQLLFCLLTTASWWGTAIWRRVGG